MSIVIKIISFRKMKQCQGRKLALSTLRLSEKRIISFNNILALKKCLFKTCKNHLKNQKNKKIKNTKKKREGRGNHKAYPNRQNLYVSSTITYKKH